MKAEIKIPDGYRRLKPGEGFKRGDWCLDFPTMEWYRHECNCSECGRPVESKEVVPVGADLNSGFYAIRRIEARSARRSGAKPHQKKKGKV